VKQSAENYLCSRLMKNACLTAL